MPRKRNNRRRRRRGGLGRLLRPLSVLLAAGAVVAALPLFFKVDQVIVSGCVRYQPEEIVSASGVQRGDNLILLDRYRTAQMICDQLPYVSEVRVNRDLPDTLLLEIVETKAVAAIQGSGAYWLLGESSSALKVLEMTDTAAADYIQVTGVQAADPAAGKPLALPEDAPITAERLSELFAALRSRDMLGRVDSVELDSPEELALNYDGRFRVELYYDADFDFKLNCLQGAVAQLQPNERGVIRMTMKDDNEVRFIPYAPGEAVP